MSSEIYICIIRGGPMEYSGKEIKALRKVLKMSQTEFGEALGVTKLSVINWELGKTEIRKESVRQNIKRLMEEHNVANADDLFNGVEVVASDTENKVYVVNLPYETFEPPVLISMIDKFLSNADISKEEKLFAIRSIRRKILDFEDGIFDNTFHIWPDEYIDKRKKD